MQKIIIASLITASLATTGCGGLLIGGAAVAGVAAIATVHDRRTPGTVIDDKNLEAVISKKLLADDYLDDYSHTNLTVYNGIVLVTGEASSNEVRNKIISKINSVPNIKKVEHDIVIMAKSSLFSRGSDSAVTSKVKTALLSLDIPNFDSSLVNVSTERGNVYIMGLVTKAEGNAIAAKASKVSGVKSVTKVFEYTD